MEGYNPERSGHRPVAQPVAICRGHLARVTLPRPFSVGGAVHDSVSDDDQHRPPPLFVPPPHHLKRQHPDDFIGSGVPSPSGTVRTPSDEISSLLGHGWGEEGFERPPPSALVNTFQRLGVSASDATQHEPKRLRASPWPRVDSPGNLSVDADLATRGSTSGIPSGLASPAMDEATRCEYLSEPWRRSPSDNERLSPVSQMLLCGRPGMLQRHLAAIRWESSGTMGGGDGTVMAMSGAHHSATHGPLYMSGAHHSATHGPLYRTAAATRAGAATPACCAASAGCCAASSSVERMSGVDEGEYRDPHSPPVMISPSASAPSWAPMASYRHGGGVPSSPSAVPSSPSSERPVRPQPALVPLQPAALLAGMREVPGALTPVPRRRLAARGSRASDERRDGHLSVESHGGSPSALMRSLIGGPFSQRLAEFHSSPTEPEAGPVPARHVSLDSREPPPALAPHTFGLLGTAPMASLAASVAARERAPRAGTPSPNRPTSVAIYRSESISGFIGSSPNGYVPSPSASELSPLCTRASYSGLHVSASRNERRPSHDREWTGDE